jgi:Ca2+-transporting ATPase
MDDEKSGLLIATKGAPEAIADLCRLNAEDRRALMISVEDMAARGMRVLGVARATHQSATLPDSQREFAFEFIGLVGLADPLRPSVPEAVRQCRSAGIKVIMITGDYPATARAIAREAGIDADMVIAGDELNTLSDPDLAARLRSGTIFARIMPEQKLRIVEALKANGEVVAMTGDGVNDAPSLKAAHIGIAMGGRGTDVAREASSIVLLDDDFGSVVKAIMLGRRIYDNLRKAVGFIIAVHVPIAGLALMPLLLGFPLLLEPIHIAFLEMVIDPVCTLVFEAESEEDDIIRRPPRNPAEPLFSNTMIGWGVFQGAIAMAMVGAIFFLATQRGMPEVEVRALTFFALFFSIIGLVFVNRSYSTSVIRAFTRPNATLVIVLAIVTSVLGLTTLWPAVRDLFNFGPLYIGDILLTLAAGVSVLVLLDLAKIPLLRRATRQRP